MLIKGRYMKQRKRDEIKLEDTWDLTYIYKTDDEFYSDLKKVSESIEVVSKYRGKLLESAKTLLEFLKKSDEVERKLYKLYYYAHLKLDQDTTNTFYQAMEGKVTNLLQEYSVLTSFVMPELMKGDYQTVLNYIKEEKELEVYRFNLEEVYRYQEHSLSEEKEELLSHLSKSLGSASEAFESLTDADISFPDLIIDGKRVSLTESNYSMYLDDPKRSVRKQAFTKLLGTYGKFKNTLASTFKNNVELLTSMARIKKFNSSLEASLYPDNISVDVYNSLINTVNNNLNVLYKYYELKRKSLGLSKLHLYDIYAPMVENFSKNYTFSEAKELVLEALSVLGDDYIKNLNKAFDERWIDIYNNKGKRTGAYSSGFYDTKPYLLLNYEGKYNDVTTLAHELGHSMHTYYSCENQPYNLSSYNIFVAEVASTVNELLLVKYLLNKSEEKKEQLFLLNKLLELYKGTIYRQVMFAEFERDMHASCEEGEVLTYDYLNEKYYCLVQKYFGKKVVCDKLIENEWMRIPHFYYNFYVYKYAIGLSCATKIVDDILSGKENAIENYLSFLKTGGSMYPALELKVAGVNIYDENLYLNAIKAFDGYIDSFTKILNK